MTEIVEVCYHHSMIRGEGEDWQQPPVQIAPTDLFDDADFVESTCPQCSSDEEPLDVLFRRLEGLEGVQAREYPDEYLRKHGG